MQESYFKKVIDLILVFVFILNSNTLFSQIELGLKGGLSFNSVSNKTFFFESEDMSHNLFEKSSGTHIGLYTKIKFLNSFFIQPEVYYSSIKKKYDLTFPLDHEMYVVDEYKQNRIIVPVLIGFDLFNRVSLFVGPNFSFNSNIFFEDNDENITLNSLYQKSNINLQYGLSVKFNKIVIDFRIERGFNDREIKIVDTIINDVDQIIESDGFLTMMSIGYKF